MLSVTLTLTRAFGCRWASRLVTLKSCRGQSFPASPWLRAPFSHPSPACVQTPQALLPAASKRLVPRVRFISGVKAQPTETWSPGVSFWSARRALQLHCMLEDVVSLGRTSILNEKGGSILFKLGSACWLLAACPRRPARAGSHRSFPGARRQERGSSARVVPGATPGGRFRSPTFRFRNAAGSRRADAIEEPCPCRVAVLEGVMVNLLCLLRLD